MNSSTTTTIPMTSLNNSTTRMNFSSTLSTNEILFKNGSSLYQTLIKLMNISNLYEHQIADLIEPEKYSATGIHLMIWILSILTYLLAIPVAVRIFRTRAFTNVIDYFSFQIILCAFIAWIPASILLIHQWFAITTLRLCRLHYVILSTNETVPLLFVLYMIFERFLYVYPSIQSKLTTFSKTYFIYLYAVFTWLIVMLIYAIASPFERRDATSRWNEILVKYCSYNYKKLRVISSVRSIIYFILFVPALITIGFVLRYFYLMRGTNQISAIQKLWTIRVTALLCVLVFYDIYLYYLENIVETYKSFLLAALLHSTFYLVQLLIIICTETYWWEFIVGRCGCLCCWRTGFRRETTVPVSIPAETEFNTAPFSSSLSAHYSLVDDTIEDEFDRATVRPEPSLRVIV